MDGRYIKGYYKEGDNEAIQLDAKAGMQFVTDERLFWSRSMEGGKSL